MNVVVYHTKRVSQLLILNKSEIALKIFVSFITFHID